MAEVGTVLSNRCCFCSGSFCSARLLLQSPRHPAAQELQAGEGGLQAEDEPPGGEDREELEEIPRLSPGEEFSPDASLCQRGSAVLSVCLFLR